MLDLKLFDTESAASKGAELHLTIPGSRELAYLDMERQRKPLKIRLLGADSKVYMREQQKKLRAMRKQRNADQVDLEKAELEASELYAKMTLGWENIPGDNGQPMEFSESNAITLYRKYKDIRVQVGNFIADQENFTAS